MQEARTTSRRDAPPSPKTTSAVLAVGMALHNAWVCSAMYSVSMFGTVVDFPGVRGASFSLLYIVSSVGFFATALAACCLDQRLKDYARSPRHMAFAAVLTCVSTLMSLVTNVLPGPLGVAVEVVAGFATGVGSATLMLFWGVGFAREDERLTVPATFVGVAGGFALNVLVLQAIPFPFGGIAAALLPLLECACLVYVSPAPGDDVAVRFNAIATSKLRFGLTVAEATVLMGFALALLKQTSVQTTFSDTTYASKLVVLVLSVFLASVPLVVFKLSGRDGDWQFLLRTVLPGSACVVLIASLAMGEHELFFEMFMVAAYFMCEGFVWLFGVFTAHRLRLSPIFLFGLLRGTATMAMLLGAIAIQYASSAIDLLPPDGKGFVLVAVLLVLFATRLLPRESAMVRKVVRCPASRILITEMEERFDAAAGGGASERDAAARSPHSGDGAEGADGGPTATPAAARPSSQRAGAGGGGPAGGTGAGAGQRPGGDAGAGTGAGAGMGGGLGGGGGRFSRKIRRVADIYFLTERETDILFEWVKGNGTTYIQDKYSISEGTVKTHIRNIYRKLDIHKKSDLMRLIDEIDNYD